MKRSLIFLLAAGPFFVFGQRLELPPKFKSFQFAGPGPGRAADTAFFQRGLTGPGGPVWLGFPEPAAPGLQSGLPTRVPSFESGLVVRVPMTTGFIVREMPPDRMPCLVLLRMPEQMPMSRRGNADPLPNAVLRH